MRGCRSCAVNLVNLMNLVNFVRPEPDSPQESRVLSGFSGRPQT